MTDPITEQRAALARCEAEFQAAAAVLDGMDWRTAPRHQIHAAVERLTHAKIDRRAAANRLAALERAIRLRTLKDNGEN